MFQRIQQIKDKNAKYILIALQFVVVLLLIFKPEINTEITSFSDRVMGNGFLAGIDISKRINSFNLLLFILIPVAIIAALELLKKILNDTDSRIIKFMNIVAVLGIINTVIKVTTNIQGTPGSSLSTCILLLINLTTIFIILLSKIFKKKVDFNNLKWSFLSAIPIAFFMTLILNKIGIRVTSNSTTWIICYFLGVVFLEVLIHFKWVNNELLKKAYTIFLIAPLLESIYLEAYNILNQYNIILHHKILTIGCIYLICMIGTMIYYIVNRNKKIVYHYTKYYYPIILITFAFIIAAIHMTTPVSTELFEAANHGEAVYELLRYGKIPVFETFDAHMMDRQIWGIIYGILNNDALSGAYCLYISYKQILILIIEYFFFKKLFARDISFLIVLFFPIEIACGLSSDYMALIGILTLIYAYREKTFKSYLLYYLSLAFLCIWKLDIGFSISIATVATLIFLLWKDRKNIKLKNAIVPFFIVVGIFLLFYLGICIIKDINPITRVIEFLKISMSNINWGLASLGDKTKFSYIFAYYIIPIIVTTTLIYLVYKNIKTDKKVSSTTIILIVLALYYISDFTRGITRHSLVEEEFDVFNLFALFLSIFMYQNYRKNTNVFLSTYVIVGIFISLSLGTTIENYNNTFNRAINKYTTFGLHYESYEEKTDRIKMNERFENEIINLNKVLDAILEDDETFLDYSNQTLIYALLDREKPVYVNQSPGLLSGEYSQQLYIDEVEHSKKDVTIVLRAVNMYLSMDLDDISNDYRYYLVSEYISQNYLPLAQVSGYDILVRKDVYDEKQNKLEQMDEVDEIEIVTKEKYLEKYGNSSKLGYIPFVWANYDANKDHEEILQEIAKDLVIKATEVGSSNVEQEESRNILNLQLDDINKENGNYLKLRIASENNTSVRIAFYSKEKKMQEYVFNVKKGTYNYTIRTSTMYAWYEGHLNKLEIEAKDDIEIKEMKITEADTIKELK